jgi:hypothetical protein
MIFFEEIMEDVDESVFLEKILFIAINFKNQNHDIT